MDDEKIKGVKKHLCSLQKLYRLLQTDDHGLQVESSSLDDSSRSLLKNLLDDAANRVLDAHSEIISTQLGDTTLNHQPYNLTNISQQVTHHVLQSTKTGMNVGEVTLHNKDKRKMTTTSMHHIIQPLTEIQQNPPCLDKSNPSFPSVACENTTKKRCRFCRQSSVKQLKSTVSLLPINESQNSSTNQLNGIPTTFSFGTGGPNKELGFTDQARHERNLKSQNQSRSILSEYKRNPLENVAADGEFGVKHKITEQEASKTIELIESCIVALQKLVSLAKQVEPKEKKNLSPEMGLNLPANSSTNTESEDIIKSLHSNHSLKKEMSNQRTGVQNVKTILEKMESLRLAANQNGYTMPGQLSIKKVKTSPSSISSPVSYIHYHKADGSTSSNLKKRNQRLSSSSESDGANSSLEYSSSGSTSQQDFSCRGSVTSRGSSAYTGDSLCEYYRSFSSGSDVDPSSSCESLPSGSDSLAPKCNHGKSKGIGIRMKGDWTKPSRQIGGLRKLKDKLAIIFQQHHHHHHHHDERQNESKGKEALREKKAVKKVVRKSKVEQEGHFGGLVNGLLDHLKREKKSKVGVKKMEKWGVKKKHWWEMLRRQRGGGKWENRKIGKLGYGSRR